MQYFLDDFWNFHFFDLLRPLTLPFHDHFTSKKLSFHISTFWNSKILTFLDPLDPIFFASYFDIYPPNKKRMINRIWGVFSWNNLGQPIILAKFKIIKLLMKSEIFSRSMDHLCLNQECRGILIFLANSPFICFWSAWIIGIYGKPIFWTLGISKNPLPPTKYWCYWPTNG